MAHLSHSPVPFPLRWPEYYENSIIPSIQYPILPLHCAETPKKWVFQGGGRAFLVLGAVTILDPCGSQNPLFGYANEPWLCSFSKPKMVLDPRTPRPRWLNRRAVVVNHPPDTVLAMLKQSSMVTFGGRFWRCWPQKSRTARGWKET